MTSISSTSSGSNYVSGIASGLDTDALVTAAVNSKLKGATRLDDQVSSNTTRISAYQNLQTYTKAATDALAKLKSGADSSFSAKAVTLKSSSSTGADTILSATADNTAKAGSYKMVVQQLAQAMSVTGTAQSSTTTALGMNGSFDLALDGKTSVTINVTAGMSLKDIATAIDNAAGSSGVEAELMQSGSGTMLVLNGTSTAKSFTVSNVTGDDVLGSLGITNGSGGFTTVAQQAQQAIVTFNGATVTSDTNTLSNIITGVTVSLDNASPSTTVTLNIGNDTSGITDALNDFITAYNTLHDYLAQNQSVGDDGTVSSSAYLYGEPVLRNMTQTLSQLLPASYGTGDYTSLGSLGITLDTSNHLVLDKDTLDTVLTDHFSDVQSFFANGGGFADKLYTMLNAYSGTNGLIDGRITQLQTVNGDLTSKSDRIKEQADSYKQLLITRYAAMETKIQSANILKKQIEAILAGSTSNNDN